MEFQLYPLPIIEFIDCGIVPQENAVYVSSGVLRTFNKKQILSFINLISEVSAYEDMGDYLFAPLTKHKDKHIWIIKNKYNQLKCLMLLSEF